MVLLPLINTNAVLSNMYTCVHSVIVCNLKRYVQSTSIQYKVTSKLYPDCYLTVNLCINDDIIEDINYCSFFHTLQGSF